MNKYSKEFKEQALQLSDEIGVKKASEDLGVSSCVKLCMSLNQAITSGNGIVIK